ncbi:unnamed protein product [Amoebophrya sp. A25]|nr:unnamed protein product [Amoebophrya sp. A25]|eukprot:GSA25T00009936001.1
MASSTNVRTPASPSAALVREKRAGPKMLVETIPYDEAATKARMKPPNEELQQLGHDVAAMGAVFEEANKAREEQRRVMDELHNDLLLRIQNVRDYMAQEVARLEATLASFQSKFEHELRTMREELMTKLNTKITQVRASIAKLNERIDQIRDNLETEIKERKAHVLEVLVPIQRDVAQLVVQLEEEKKARHTNEAESRKNLQDAVDLLEKTLDIEKFNREQQYMDFKVLTEYERERILKRQYVIEYQMKKALDVLDVKIQDETGDRIEKQDGVVGTMTTFVRSFQQNIREDAKMS